MSRYAIRKKGKRSKKHVARRRSKSRRREEQTQEKPAEVVDQQKQKSPSGPLDCSPREAAEMQGRDPDAPVQDWERRAVLGHFA